MSKGKWEIEFIEEKDGKFYLNTYDLLPDNSGDLEHIVIDKNTTLIDFYELLKKLKEEAI